MRIACLITLLITSNVANAEVIAAVLSWDDIEGEVKYSWQVKLELGDPNYSHVKAVHVGKRNSVTQHPFHTDYTILNNIPFWTKESSPPNYNLHVGTQEYCSTLSPFSEFTGPGLDPLPFFQSNCEYICWDLCQNC